MEINIEDNIHKLRLRLIDSVIDWRAMINESRDVFRNSIINDEVRINISNEHVRCCFYCREINLSDDALDRIGMDNGPMNGSEVDRGAETHRVQVRGSFCFKDRFTEGFSRNP